MQLRKNFLIKNYIIYHTKKNMKKAISWEEFLHHIHKNTKYALIWFIIIVIILGVVITCSIALPIIYGDCRYGLSPNSLKCNEPVRCKNNMRSTSGKCCTNGLTRKSGKYCNQPCKVEQGTPVILSNKGQCCQYGVTVKGSSCFPTLCTTVLKLQARSGNDCVCLYGFAPNGKCAYKCTNDGNQIDSLISYSGKCCSYGLTSIGRSDGNGVKQYHCNEKCTVDGVQKTANVSPYGMCCSFGIAKDGTNCNRNCGSNYLTTDKHWTTSGMCCEYDAAPGLTECNTSKKCDTTGNVNRTYRGRCCTAGVTKYRYECNAKCDEGDKNTSRGKCCPSADDNDNEHYANTCENPKCGSNQELYNIYTTYVDGVAQQHNVCCATSVGANAMDTACNHPCPNGTLSAKGYCCKSGITTYKEYYNICNEPCCNTGPKSVQNIKTQNGGKACAHTAKGNCAQAGFTRKNGIAKNIIKNNPPLYCTNTTQFSAMGKCCKTKTVDNKFYQGVAVDTSFCNMPCGTKSYNSTKGSCKYCPNGVTTANTIPTKCNQSCGCGNNTSKGACTNKEIHNQTRKGKCCATGLALCNNGYKCMEQACEYNGTYDCNKCYQNPDNGYHTKHGNFCGYTYYGEYNHILISGDNCVAGGIYPSQW
jgi:hypothetical protein